MNTTIATHKLTKKYSDVTAVSDISLHVSKGEIYGFLGLNGAGKTTTIRMLLGMITPTGGEAYIDGHRVVPGNTELWKNIGYLVEVPYAYPELTVRENLEIFRRMRLVDDKHAVTRVMEKLDLIAYADRKAGNLSLGNAQRLGIAKALLHHPSILLLDEPANGLDPAGIAENREMLVDLAKNHGVTIFISSHILNEISKLATRIGIIHRGVLLQELNTAEIEYLSKKRLKIDTVDNQLAMAILKKAGIEVSKDNNGMLEISDKETLCHPENIAVILVNNNVPPCFLTIVEEDLESYFLRTIKTTDAEGKVS